MPANKEILGWTGWKGEVRTALNPQPSDTCSVCGVKIAEGDELVIDHAITDTHWACRPGLREPERLFAQWVFYADDSPVMWYASAPGSQGQTKRGGLFDISVGSGQSPITRQSAPIDRRRAREDAFTRLLSVIPVEMASRVTTMRRNAEDSGDIRDDS